MSWNQISCVIALASAAIAAGCGDNSKQCGEGTQDVDGVCMGMGEGNNCGPGTVDVDGTCVPEEEACAAGETAVEGNCVQIDLQEGAEPNGSESGANPAGVLTLGAAGDRFTANGCINNQPSASNDDPDFDRYTLTITEPALVKLTVDGRGGMVGGFRALPDAADADLVGYQRLGLSIASDMSRRQVYLPKAGTYEIDVADSRTLMPLVTGGTLPPAGNPDGTTSCYLLHLEAQAIPAATPLVAGTPATGTIGEDLAFFTSAFTDGITSVTATIEPTGDVHSSTSLVVMNNNQLRQFSAADGFTLFGGIKAGDTPLLVLDYVYNYALEAAPYEIAIDFEMDSVPLNRDGTPTAPTPSKGRFFRDSAGNHFENINLFHWEVTEPNTTDGFNITFSIPMAGVIIDQNTFFVAPFASTNTVALGGSPTSTSTTTFTNYTGLVRNDTPGTYYFFVYAPRSAVGTNIIATSTITTLEETPIVLGTETAPQMPNVFNSNPFSYDAGTTEPWQRLNATGTATSTLQVSFYDESTPGRFDPLRVRIGTGAGTINTIDKSVVPLIAHTFAANGSTPIGRIFKNPVSATLPITTEYFVQVVPTAKTGASRSFKLDFEAQTYHHFGALAAGSTSTVNDQPLTTAIPERRFYFDALPNSTVTVTVTPDVATMDPVLAFVEPDEAEHFVIDDGIENQAETFTYTQNGSGYTAFIVRAPGVSAVPRPFTVTVQIDPPAYTATSGSTQFSDICATGTLHPAGGIFGDEGFTTEITTIDEFTFFGAAPATEFRASTNGFLTFDPNAFDPNYFPAPIPDEVGEANVAPLWNDIFFAQICSKVDGTKQIVQWTGEDYNTAEPVEMQVILDAADDSIEFVYGPGHAVLGSASTAGIQELGGLSGFSTGVFSDFVTPGSSVKLTPTP
jgi:hypothetical protein